jgi:H+/Cl- antiporter ClcA
MYRPRPVVGIPTSLIDRPERPVPAHAASDHYIAAVSGPVGAIPFLIPALGGAIVGPLIYFFAREAKGHGVPEVMAAVALRGGVIRKRIVAVKALASAISIGSGGSVGREGPIVQIASALGSSIGQALKVPASQLRVIVACGAAAGVDGSEGGLGEVLRYRPAAQECRRGREGTGRGWRR